MRRGKREEGDSKFQIGVTKISVLLHFSVDDQQIQRTCRLDQNAGLMLTPSYSSCLLCLFRHSTEMTASPSIKTVVWIGSTRTNKSRFFPEDVKDVIDYGHYLAQRGGKHADAKPLGDSAVRASWRSLRTASAMHIAPCTRSVWPVALYVLHVFQKKSKSGIRTPKSEIELIRSRLKRAEEEHVKWLGAQKE